MASPIPEWRLSLSSKCYSLRWHRGSIAFCKSDTWAVAGHEPGWFPFCRVWGFPVLGTLNTPLHTYCSGNSSDIRPRDTPVASDKRDASSEIMAVHTYERCNPNHAPCTLLSETTNETLSLWLAPWISDASFASSHQCIRSCLRVGLISPETLSSFLLP